MLPDRPLDFSPAEEKQMRKFLRVEGLSPFKSTSGTRIHSFPESNAIHSFRELVDACFHTDKSVKQEICFPRPERLGGSLLLLDHHSNSEVVAEFSESAMHGT